MPRATPRLAEEGRIREDWEYIEWAARVSRDAEDIRYSTTEEGWKQHYRDKYWLSPDRDLADKQLDALWSKGIVRAWEDMPKVEVLPSTRYTTRGYYFQYRDITTKRFISYQTVADRLAGLYK